MGEIPDFGDLPLTALGGVTIQQALTALGVVVVPALLVGAGLVTWAWARGWEPHRLRNVAAVVLGVSAVAGPVLGTVPWWGVENVVVAVRQAWEGQWIAAAVNSGGATVPVVAVGAWWWWHGYTRSMRSGERAAAGERHVRRQQQIREATAVRRARCESTPLSRSGAVVLGPRVESVRPHPELWSETVTRRSEPWLAVPLSAIGLHMACVGQTGSGKTTLLERLSAGWLEQAWAARLQVSGPVPARPLVVFLAAKGGPAAGEDARSWADAMEDLGLSSERVGVFPFEARLNMWRMAPDQLRASLHKLAKTDHRFYDVLQRGLLHLVVDAPGGPPCSSVEFLERLDAAWLWKTWEGHAVERRTIRALAKSAGSGTGPSALDTDLMLFAELFRSVGGDFDAGQPLSDFDALYVSVPGTTDPVVAAAKTAVLIELLTYELGRVGGDGPRQVLFVIDEFSAVSGEVAGTVINLVERLRSLGGAVIVSAQSYEGLAETVDERERLLGAMGGGMLVARTQNADALAARFGTRMVSEAGLQVAAASEDGSWLSGGYSGAGTVRRQHTFLLDPQRVRTMPPHHVAYATPDRVVYGVVTPLPGRSGVLGGAAAEPVAGPVVSRRELVAGQAAAESAARGGRRKGSGSDSDIWMDIDGSEQ